jgi:hypothetical protein
MACVIAGGKKSKEEATTTKSAQPQVAQPKPAASSTGNVSLAAGATAKEARKNKKCEC